jgi:hypothetical protein
MRTLSGWRINQLLHSNESILRSTFQLEEIDRKERVRKSRNDMFFFSWFGLVLQGIVLLKPIKDLTWSTCMLGLTPLKS